MRTAKTIGEATTRFVWDHSGPLPLLLSDGTNSYIYGPGGVPLEQIDGSRVPTYYHHDQVGSTRLLTEARGAATGTFTYAPYGTLAGSTGTQTTPLGFAGQYTDAETGFQYLRARYYDPASGQFTSRDPLTAVTAEAYLYAGGSPFAFTDPSGLFPFGDAFMAVSDAAAGALNEVTFGVSNRLAGVDGSCAGVGYGFGSKLGFLGSLFSGGGEAKALFRAERVASTKFGRVIEDFHGGEGWLRGSAHIERATARNHRGGISIEEWFERGQDSLVRHRIYDRDERLVHETFRDTAKFGAP